jgi:hypothetical protein
MSRQFRHARTQIPARTAGHSFLHESALMLVYGAVLGLIYVACAYAVFA